MTPTSSTSVIKTYRRYAPLYDYFFGAILEPGRRLMTRRVHALAPASVLEVGVGTGLTLFRYPQDAQVVGVDISPEMLARAERRASRLKQHHVALHLLDAEQMPFADGSFDCVTLPYVLSVTPHPHALVKELRRVCRPGGTILILNHFSGSRFWWFLERAVRSIADKVGFQSDFSYEEHILAHDWRIASVTEVNLLGLSRLVEIRNEPA
jgi:phosphatidylethanolamine/phosphatidyl-N-methylethanolamine N-methyltransferase